MEAAPAKIRGRTPRRLASASPGSALLGKCLATLAALTALQAADPTGPPEAVTVRVELQATFYPPPYDKSRPPAQPPAPRVLHCEATCTFNRRKWYITWTSPTLNLRPELLFDGTNTLSKRTIIRPPKAVPGMVERYGAKPLQPLPAGLPVWIQVTPGPFDPEGDIRQNLLWLACASSRSNLRRLPGLPVPHAIARFETPAFDHPVEREHFNDSLGLLRRARWLFPPQFDPPPAPNPYLSRSSQNADERRGYAAGGRRWPGEEGRPMAEYRVLSWTNFHGWHIPVSFTYQAKWPDAMYRRLGWDPARVSTKRAEARGQATVWPTHPGDPFPALLTNGVTYSVTDHRFRHPTRLVDAIHYTLTNATALPPTNDARLQQLFQVEVQRAPVDPLLAAAGPSPVVRGVWLAVLFIVTIAGGSLWLWRAMARDRRRNSTPT
ncbi:MAG: hypothetical protein D6766_03805 [Verrucomicrobia bacterium]|nr:MAG: hypothetical protein D6766_03805 [Verrucomicrobiota bacterium]